MHGPCKESTLQSWARRCPRWPWSLVLDFETFALLEPMDSQDYVVTVDLRGLGLVFRSDLDSQPGILDGRYLSWFDI